MFLISVYPAGRDSKHRWNKFVAQVTDEHEVRYPCLDGLGVTEMEAIKEAREKIFKEGD